jgi:hypothetical protein
MNKIRDTLNIKLTKSERHGKHRPSAFATILALMLELGVLRSSLQNNKEALLNKLGLQRAKPKTGSPLTRTKLMNDYIAQGQSRELLFLKINFPG